MQDLSPDGPLATIGASCGEFMKAKGLKRIDWTLPNMRREVGAVWVPHVSQDLCSAQL